MPNRDSDHSRISRTLLSPLPSVCFSQDHAERFLQLMSDTPGDLATLYMEWQQLLGQLAAGSLLLHQLLAVAGGCLSSCMPLPSCQHLLFELHLLLPRWGLLFGRGSWPWLLRQCLLAALPAA